MDSIRFAIVWPSIIFSPTFLPKGMDVWSRSVCQQHQVLEYSHLDCEALFLWLEAYLPHAFLKGDVPWNLNQGHFWMEFYLFLKTTCLNIVRSPWGRCSMYRKNADNISGWSDFTSIRRIPLQFGSLKKTKKKTLKLKYSKPDFFLSGVWDPFWGSLILFLEYIPCWNAAQGTRCLSTLWWCYAHSKVQVHQNAIVIAVLQMLWESMKKT